SAPSAPAVVPTGQVDSILASLSVRDRVAQLVVPWLAGSYTALDDSLFQVAARWVDTLHVGGLIMSVGSPFDIAAKLNALQRRSRLPLLISADLEWGAGMRVVGGTAFPRSWRSARPGTRATLTPSGRRPRPRAAQSGSTSISLRTPTSTTTPSIPSSTSAPSARTRGRCRGWCRNTSGGCTTTACSPR